MHITYSPTLYATPMLRRCEDNPQGAAGVSKEEEVREKGGGGGEGERRKRRGGGEGAVRVEDQCCSSMSTPSTRLALQFYTGLLAEISQSQAKALPSRSFKAAVPSLWQRFTSGLASRLGDILT